MSDIAQDLGGVVLLPCPFCGGNADTYFGNITKRHYVSCMTENCGMTGPDAHTYESAIAAWNTRAHSAEIAGALRDAERYRWLRDQASWWLVSTPDAAKLSVMLPRASIDAAIGTEGCDFDAAIDSAMQQGGGGE